ncbi:Gldg family protein [Dinghuibacter silviterrae]|uniref:ABC-2 type transport system permease protein n=1 Tax=Dinghuibacter silviterrae TaxID=1539049 RepID=A0A4R8DIS5_9BACT|nr:Gldg family protein [Dinghuibacter silviterrae]TDW97467.1 ABC-2 type transport system permease protein [Dinghuibacter silviterrae]
MKKIRKIALTELQTLFYSPIAWLILVLFAVQTGLIFTNGMKGQLQSEMMGQHFADVTGWAFRFSDMIGYFYLYIPLLSMGLMSREFSSGSIKLLYSSPVSNTQIVLGKYLAMMIYGLVLTGVLACFGIFGFFTIKDMDIPMVVTALLGMYLLICIYSAIGLFMSCLTSYQVVAAIGTLALFAALNYISHVWQGIAFVRDITYWLSITGRVENMLHGLINSEDILYFLIIVALFLFLAVFKLDMDKVKRSRGSNLARFSSVVVIAMLLGYVTSRPALMGFYDVTRTKINTLTPNSQEIVKNVKGPLTITTYVNLFESNFDQCVPDFINFDLQNFREYLRFKPDIRMKYVYYYAQTDQSSPIAHYPGLNDRQRMERACAIKDLDPDIFLSPEELKKKIDLSGERFRFVRVLETEDGRKGFLRLFNDPYKHPGEREISAAMKRLAMDLPTVGFLAGHGARDIDNFGDKGYFDFTNSGYTRSALLNQGFNVREVNLADSAVPTDMNILVLADLKTPLTDAEDKKLDDYIARGGNLLVIGDPGRQASMNPIAGRFGVSFLPGRIVQPHPYYAPDFILVRPTKVSEKMSYELGGIRKEEGVVAMDGACGLSYTTDKGFTATSWFGTEPTGSWNELETTNFGDDTVVLNPKAGEVETAYTTVLALSRTQNGHDQRIIVMGDADCVDNANLSTGRRGIRPMNNTMIDGLFYWLSGDKVPIDVRRPPMTDDHVYLSLSGMKWVNLSFVWILPALLAVFGTVLLIRRKRK